MKKDLIVYYRMSLKVSLILYYTIKSNKMHRVFVIILFFGFFIREYKLSIKLRLKSEFSDNLARLDPIDSVINHT
jgi:hypothetical protein